MIVPLSDCLEYSGHSIREVVVMHDLTVVEVEGPRKNPKVGTNNTGYAGGHILKKCYGLVVMEFALRYTESSSQVTLVEDSIRVILG